jgi:hypothetical protein
MELGPTSHSPNSDTKVGISGPRLRKFAVEVTVGLDVYAAPAAIVKMAGHTILDGMTRAYIDIKAGLPICEYAAQDHVFPILGIGKHYRSGQCSLRYA